MNYVNMKYEPYRYVVYPQGWTTNRYAYEIFDRFSRKVVEDKLSLDDANVKCRTLNLMHVKQLELELHADGNRQSYVTG